MINYIKIAGFLLFTTILSSCVKDGLDKCPEGRVQINLFVEKFQNRSDNPLDDSEDFFCDRVSHLRYYLYKDGALIKEHLIEDFTATSGPSYAFSFTDLEYGSYKLLVVGNCTKTALSGDPAKDENLVLTYPGALDTEDYFSTVFPFTVNSDDFKEYNVGLLRTQGIIRYTFINMPESVSEFEIEMQNVSNEKWITGDYKKSCSSVRRYLLSTLDTKQSGQQDQEEEYMIATFPTLPDTRSSYSLSLYENNRSEPLIKYLVTDTLNIRRNQLIDIAVTFNDGTISFDIELDPEWDGSSSGGEVGIQ